MCAIPGAPSGNRSSDRDPRPSTARPSVTRGGRVASSSAIASGWLLAWALLLCPTAATAQDDGGCQLVEGSQRLQTEPDPRGGLVTRLTTPHFACGGDVEIWADSAVAYSYDNMSILWGAVRYRDPQRELRADHARYFTRVGRLQADGNVSVVNHEDGSTIHDGDLVYLRQTDFRDIEEMTVTIGDDGVRPHATVYPRRAPGPADSATAPGPVDTASTPGARDSFPPDSAAGGLPADSVGPDTAADAAARAEPSEALEPGPPQEYLVVGDSLFFRGSSYFTAAGTVEITRDSLLAFADTAEYDGAVGELVLDGSARVESSSYDLIGRRIILTSSSDGSDEIRALRDAVLTGDDLEVTAPRVVLHLTDGELQRMVAVPLPDGAGRDLGPRRPAADTDVPDSVARTAQPRAVAQDFELTADSLDLAAPGGELDRIFAAGRAHSVSSGRSELNVEALPEIARNDWMDADTIEVFLVPDTASALDVDTASAQPDSGYTVDRIVARVGARALYRLSPADSTAVPGVDPPAVSYLMAHEITIFMVDGQADRVESVGQVSGWHLEPLQRAPGDAEDTVDGAEPNGLAEPAPDAPPNPGGDGA